MDTPKIYVICLAAYNAGMLHGCWIEATLDVDEIYEAIQIMLANSPIDNAENWAIHDSEGFGEIKLSEFEDLETICKYAKFIIEHEELGKALIANYGIDEAQTMVTDQYYGSFISKVDFAKYVLEECYDNPIPDKWLGYFDYAAYAHDLFTDGFYEVEVDDNIHVFSY